MTSIKTLPEADATSVEVTAHLCGVGRSTIYEAINPDPAKRKGLPFLRSFKVKTARRISRDARLEWLAALEARTEQAA